MQLLEGLETFFLYPTVGPAVGGEGSPGKIVDIVVDRGSLRVKEED